MLTDRRPNFPALDREVNGHPLAYLDSAATAQKPQQVIDAVADYYAHHNANVHRCVHALAEEATAKYDDAHVAVADFIGADWDEIVFTKNATESLNLVAHSYGLNELGPDDEILLTGMEHHSMIVPWQHVAETTGATLRYADVAPDGTLDMDDLRAKLNRDIAVVGAVHASNVTGAVNPVADIVELAHDHDAVAVIDAAQSVPHMPVDVREMDADFVAFSGHKLYGPTGIGVLYGKKALLQEMEPFLRGGDMISRVTRDGAEWNTLPWKFEAGTPNIAGAVGLAAAVDYLQDVGMDAVERHTRELGGEAYERLSALDGVDVLGPADRTGLAAFTVENAHPHDVSTLLNEQGIAVRGGHHCAQPLADALGVTATTRASFGLYSTADEVDRLVDAVEHAAEVFA